MVSFRKSISLGKGLRLNLSTRGIGLSAGVRGFRVGVNSRGTYVRTSIPGTGIYSRKYISSGGARRGTRRTSARRQQAGPAPSPGPGAAVPADTTAPVEATAAVEGTAAPGLLAMPPELTGGRVGWGWPIVVGLLGLLWSPLFLVAGVLAVAAAVTSAGPKAKAARAVQYGLASVQAGNWPMAAKNFAEARQLFPGSPRLEGLLGVALAASGRFQEAEPHLEAGYAAVPDPDFGPLVATVALANDKPERAIEVLQALPEDVADRPFAANRLGEAFLRLGHFEAAIEALKRGLSHGGEMTPDKLEGRYLLGRAYLGLGDKTKARREFERVMAYDAHYRDVESLIESLPKG